MNEELIKHAKNLIESFLFRPDVIGKAMDSYSTREWAKQRNSLRIILPRGSGTTTLIHELCHKYRCLVVTCTQDMSRVFVKRHLELYDEMPVCYSHRALSNALSWELCDLQNKLDVIQRVRQVLTESRVILFDIFSSYSDNQSVKGIFNDLGKTHKFVLLG